jgi:hypothetical protein
VQYLDEVTLHLGRKNSGLKPGCNGFASKFGCQKPETSHYQKADHLSERSLEGNSVLNFGPDLCAE